MQGRVNKKRQIFTIGEKCPYEIVCALAQLLEIGIETQRNIENQKTVFEKFPKKELYQVFKGIANTNSKYIEFEDLKKYLAKHEVYPNENDFERIIKRLDRNRDGKVSYSEFLDAFALEIMELGRESNNINNEWETVEHNDIKKEFRSQLDMLNEFNIPTKSDIPKLTMEMFSQTENRAEDYFKSRIKDDYRNVTSSIYERQSLRKSNEEYKSPKSNNETASFPPTPESIAKHYNEKPFSYEQNTSFVGSNPMFSTTQKLPMYGTPSKHFFQSSQISPSTAATSYFKNPLVFSNTSNLPIDPELMRILQAQMDITSEVEQAKIRLWLRHDFNLLEIFRLFDTSGLETITLFEFKKVLKKLDIRYNDTDVEILMKRYDQDRDGRLCVAEFERMVRPIEYLSLPKQNLSDGIKLPFSKDTIELLRKLLEKLIESEGEIEELRREMFEKCKIGKFDVVEAFHKLDNLKKGSIYHTDVNVIENIGKGIYE